MFLTLYLFIEILNAIRIESRQFNEYYLAFENYEIKFNFLNMLKSAKKLAIKK